MSICEGRAEFRSNGVEPEIVVPKADSVLQGSVLGAHVTGPDAIGRIAAASVTSAPQPEFRRKEER